MSKGILYIVATPIGNMEDMTFRSIDILNKVDYVVAENKGKTGILFAKHEIDVPMKSYREENHSYVSKGIIEDLLEGSNVAVVSDAGTPGVSDPGSKLVARAYENKIKVIPIPGPSAVSTAISCFPLAGTRYLFWGFAPRKEGEFTRTIIDNLELFLKKKTALVFFESPFRLKKTLKYLENIAETLSEKAILKVGIGKEMTKVFEAYEYGTPTEILAMESKTFDLSKGEYTLVIIIKKRQN